MTCVACGMEMGADTVACPRCGAHAMPVGREPVTSKLRLGVGKAARAIVFGFLCIFGLFSTLAIIKIEGARAGARDMKRVADVSRIRDALKLAFSETKRYPVGSGLALGGSGARVLCEIDGTPTFRGNADGCGMVYLDPLEVNPSPDGADYIYGSSAGSDAYTIRFRLGRATNGYAAGADCADQDGIRSGSSCGKPGAMSMGTSPPPRVDASASDHDAKRVSEIRQIQTALALGFSETNDYPHADHVVLGQSGARVFCMNGAAPMFQDSATGCSKIYMFSVPSNPVPYGADYVYDSRSGTGAYSLTFTLEGASGDLAAGANCANQNGIKAGDSC